MCINSGNDYGKAFVSCSLIQQHCIEMPGVECGVAVVLFRAGDSQVYLHASLLHM